MAPWPADASSHPSPNHVSAGRGLMGPIVRLGAGARPPARGRPRTCRKQPPLLLTHTHPHFSPPFLHLSLSLSLPHPLPTRLPCVPVQWGPGARHLLSQAHGLRSHLLLGSRPAAPPRCLRSPHPPTHTHTHTHTHTQRDTHRHTHAHTHTPQALINDSLR